MNTPNFLKATQVRHFFGLLFVNKIGVIVVLVGGLIDFCVGYLFLMVSLQVFFCEIQNFDLRGKE